MRRICTVLAIVALGFGLAGATSAAASVQAASGAPTMASSPRMPALTNVWSTVGWYPDEAVCRSKGKWWVDHGAKGYACEYKPESNVETPWRLRIND
jgi:hypothetical protein